MKMEKFANEFDATKPIKTIHILKLSNDGD